MQSHVAKQDNFSPAPACPVHAAVILLLDHQDKGSYGIILNRPSVYRLGQLELTHPLKGRYAAMWPCMTLCWAISGFLVARR
jgi:hypothetical protein